MALTEKDKKLLKILAVIGVIAVIYMLWTEVVPKYQQLDLEITEYREKIQTARKKSKELNRTKYKIKILETELKKLKRYFPVETENNDVTLELFAKMETLGKKLGITFSSLNFIGQPISYAGGLYKEVKLKMRPAEPMRMDKIIRLLYALDKYENILDITNLILNPLQENKSLYTIDLQLSFFMFSSDAFRE